MTVAVIVPWRDIGEPMRQKSWSLVRAGWERDFADCPLIMVDAGGEPFSRGASINAGVQEAGDVDAIIVADADVITIPTQVDAAIGMALRSPGMVQPFDRYIPLNAHDTGGVHKTGEIPMDAITITADWICVSGCIVMTPQSFRAAGGFDERFKSWGYEDSAFDLMMATHVNGRRNVPGPAYHLAHPGVIQNPADPQHQANLALWNQYQREHPYPQ